MVEQQDVTPRWQDGRPRQASLVRWVHFWLFSYFFGRLAISGGWLSQRLNYGRPAVDCEHVEVPMLPVVEGVGRASFHTALSNILLFPFTMALYLLTVNRVNIAAAIAVEVMLLALNVRFLSANVRLARTPSSMTAWRVFKVSAQYLFVALILIVMRHLL